MPCPGPPHLFKTKKLLVEGLKLMGFHGKIGIRKNDDGSYTIVIEIPAPGPDGDDDGSSDRARKRAREASRR